MLLTSGADLHKGRVSMLLKPLDGFHSAIVLLAAMLLSACGGGGGIGNPTPSPQGTYDLQAAVEALVTSGLSASVSLSGTVIVNGTSVTGTGTLTLSPGASGMFNGSTAQLQTESISGTISAAGQSAPYSSSVVNAYEPSTASIVGQSQSSEFDVAQAPIAIPTTVGTSVTVLGTMSRYADSTLSVALGTVQVSVAVALIPVDPGSPEVVQFTYKIFDTNQALVETDTYSYSLSQDNLLSFHSAATQSASGSLTVTPE
jgi:hypothetical protein